MLVFPHLSSSCRDHAYETRPPRLVFNITVDVEQQEFTVDDKPYWKKVSSLELGPHRRVARSKSYEVKLLIKSCKTLLDVTV